MPLGHLQPVLRSGPVGGGQGVGQGAGGVAGGVEVVGQLEHPVTIAGLDGQPRRPVEPTPVVLRQPGEERLADLVVDEGAGVPTGPQQVASAGLLHRSRRLHRGLPGQRSGQCDVELLAEDGPHGQQTRGPEGEDAEATSEEGGGMARGLDVGHGGGIDPPPGRLVDHGADLHQATENGGGHERVPSRDLLDHLHGLVRERPRHRGQQAPQLVAGEGRQDHAGRRPSLAQGMVVGHLLAPVGDHHDDPTTGALLRRPGSPVAHQLHRELIGPLAVVQHDEHRRSRSAQGVQERRQCRQGASLAIGLRAQGAGLDRPEDGGEAGKGVDEELSLWPQGMAHGRHERGIGPSPLHHLVDDAVEGPQGSGGHLVEALAPQHPDPLLGGPLGQLAEHPRLAAPGAGFDHHQAAAIVPSARQRRFHHGQFGLTGDEGGLGQRPPMVLGADDHPWGGLVALASGVVGGGDRVEVDQGGARRVVTVGRLLHQQALHHLVEGAGQGHAHGPQAGDWCIHVLAQDITDGFAPAQRPPGQAFEQHRAGRVQIGALVDLVAQKPGRLRRGVASRSQPRLRHAPAGLGQVRQPEVGQCGLRDPATAAIDDHVGRTDVTVQHAAAVGRDQACQHAPPDVQRVVERQRARREARLEGHAGDERQDEVQEPAVAPHGKETAGGPSEATESRGLPFETDLAGRGVGAADRADDDWCPVGEIGAEQRDTPGAGLQGPDRTKATPVGALLGLWRHRYGRSTRPLVTPPPTCDAVFPVSYRTRERLP